MNRILISIFAILLVTNKGFTTEAPAESSPQWIAHVSSPGPDYPVIGYSLFDRLFLKNTRGNREYAIPFPMELIVLSDFRILQDAITQMVFETIAGRSQTLTSQPVRQQVIISELEKILGLEALKW